MGQITIYVTANNSFATASRLISPSYEEFATIRAGVGTYVNPGSAYAAIQKAAGGYYELMRGGMIFPTGGLLTYPAKITSAYIWGYLIAKNNALTQAGGVTVVNPNPASPGSWSASDYQRFTTTVYSANHPISSMGDTWVSLELNAAGIAAINKTGDSYFGIRMTDDVDGDISPVGNYWDGIAFRQDHQSYPSQDPYMVINYEYPIKINIGDSWKDVVDGYVNIGDSWKSISEFKLNVSDSWKVIF